MSGLRAFLGEHAGGLLDHELVLDALDLATCGVMIRHWRNDSVDTSDASASLSIFVSRKFKSTFDVISTDEVGFEPSHIDSIIHPEDRQHHCHRNERPMDYGPMPVAEYRLRDRSGRYRPVRDQAVQVTLADGNAVSISVLTDDDLQREHQQNLWDRSQDIQRILDTVPTCIWYKDQSGRILRCNRAAAEATGLSVAEIEGRLTEE
ncbi:MAG: PAS domain-containing protein, partial [Planctomycetota bacterium]